MRLRYFKKAGGGGGVGGVGEAPSDGSKYARQNGGWVAVTDGYIDGEVETYADLPVTVGTPAVDSAYLVREASGLWLVARKPAGIYIRTGNAGALTDWTHAGAFPDAFSDDNFEVYDGSDSSKLLGFSLGGITTGTKRTATWPDKSGTVAMTSDLGMVTVSITGTATTAVAANTIYRHSGASAYTSTLTTAGLATGAMLYIQIANTATALITISCAAGIRGATTKVMRNGEALHLYWTGTTFDILGEVFIPFKGTIAPNAPATISTGTNTKVGINTVIGDNPGYGMLDTANQRIVFPRAGVYQLIAAVRYDNLSANAVRAIQAYTYDGVTFFNQEEASILAGGQGFVGTTSSVTVTAAGKILELTAWQNSGANALIKGNGTTENTRLVILQLS